jgi:hypothetical protein
VPPRRPECRVPARRRGPTAKRRPMMVSGLAARGFGQGGGGGIAVDGSRAGDAASRPGIAGHRRPARPCLECARAADVRALWPDRKGKRTMNLRYLGGVVLVLAFGLALPALPAQPAAAQGCVPTWAHTNGGQQSPRVRNPGDLWEEDLGKLDQTYIADAESPDDVCGPAPGCDPSMQSCLPAPERVGRTSTGVTSTATPDR